MAMLARWCVKCAKKTREIILYVMLGISYVFPWSKLEHLWLENGPFLEGAMCQYNFTLDVFLHCLN